MQTTQENQATVGERFQLSMRSEALRDTKVDLEQYVATFHDWIRASSLDGLLIDVASYAHVPEGPGVLLIGHEMDYGVRVEAGRIKVTCRHKRLPEGGAHALRRCLRHLLHAASLLQTAQHLNEAPRFFGNEFVFRSNDRLSCPNDDATTSRVGPLVGDVFCNALGVESLEIASIGARREGLTLWLKRPAFLGPADDIAVVMRRLKD